MGVHCYESYEGFQQDPNNILTVANPPGHKCPGAQFSAPYTCGQAFDGYFHDVDVASAECTDYVHKCCDQPDGQQDHGSSTGHNCDEAYCGTTCLPWAYCATPAADAKCANAPPDCSVRCAGCGTPPGNGTAAHTAT